MKPIFKGHNAELVNQVFQTLLVMYLVLLLAEQVWPTSVSAYFNLNYFLIIVIVSGILDAFAEHKIKKGKVTKKDYVFVVILGVLGFVVIRYKTGDLGWLSWIVSMIAGILIILLSLLILDEDKEEEKETNKKEHEFKSLPETPHIKKRLRLDPETKILLFSAIVGLIAGLVTFGFSEKLGRIAYVLSAIETAGITILVYYFANKINHRRRKNI
jgi:Ca2+/Na+ antiporter